MNGKKPLGVGLLGTDFNLNGQIPPASALGLDGGSSEAAVDNLYGGFQTPEIMVHDDQSQFDPASLRQSLGGASSVQMMAQNHASTYKNAIETLS